MEPARSETHSSPALSLFGFLRRKRSRFSFDHKPVSIAVSTATGPLTNALAHADCQSAIQPIDNRRYSVAQTGGLLYRRLLTGYGCATTCANFVNGAAKRAKQVLRAAANSCGASGKR